MSWFFIKRPAPSPATPGAATARSPALAGLDRGERAIFFHEDDYCQQEFLPRAMSDYATSELGKIAEFADAHRAPGGLGWTEMYVRPAAPLELATLGIRRDDFAAIVAPAFPSFDSVWTGYSAYRAQCKRTAAWGTGQGCALLADWDDASVIMHAWADWFDHDENSIRAAARVAALLGRRYPLLYVDWAWGYTCDPADEDAFASKLRAKLRAIAGNENRPVGGNEH